MFIELHILQSFGPTNLNRDEDGNPKDCEFGGVRRARISSQCLKRAIRYSPTFKQMIDEKYGYRSSLLADNIRKKLIAKGMDDPLALQSSDQFMFFYSDYSSKKKTKLSDKRKQKALDESISYPTDVLVYLSLNEISQAVMLLADKIDPQKVVDQIVKSNKNHTSAPDIALFGRFLANRTGTNIDAAVQVAHAISTHRVSFEYDFFTAVDDLKPSDDPGAGMMGSIGYNSACYYRYARLDWNKLLENLDDSDLALRTVSAFLQASLDANPSGMQNSHDNQTPPALALAVVREDGGGWSLANAFESPVRASRDGGLIVPSVERLADAYEVLATNMDDSRVRAFALVLQPGINLKSLINYQVTGRKAWNEAVLAALNTK